MSCCVNGGCRGGDGVRRDKASRPLAGVLLWGGGQGPLLMAAPFCARRPRRLKRSPAWRQGREAAAECRGFGRPWEDGNRGRAGDKAAAAAGAASRADAVCRGRRAPRRQRPRPSPRVPRPPRRASHRGLRASVPGPDVGSEPRRGRGRLVVHNEPPPAVTGLTFMGGFWESP